jgi:hypothetical protein
VLWVRVPLVVQNASVAKLVAREGLKIPWAGMSVSVRVRPEVLNFDIEYRIKCVNDGKHFDRLDAFIVQMVRMITR